jgi:hypothetical protein
MEEADSSVSKLHLTHGVSMTTVVVDDWGSSKLKTMGGQPFKFEGSQIRIPRAEYARLTSAGQNISV